MQSIVSDPLKHLHLKRSKRSEMYLGRPSLISLENIHLQFLKFKKFQYVKNHKITSW
jgi:hypothetical protein